VGLLTLSAAAVLRSKSYLRSLEARILQVKKDMALLEGDILEARARIAYFNREIEYWEQAAKWPADLYGRPPKSMAELQDEKQRAVGWVRRLTMDHKDLWIEIGYLQETLEKELNAQGLSEPASLEHSHRASGARKGRKEGWGWLVSVAGIWR